MDDGGKKVTDFMGNKKIIASPRMNDKCPKKQGSEQRIGKIPWKMETRDTLKQSINQKRHREINLIVLTELTRGTMIRDLHELPRDDERKKSSLLKIEVEKKVTSPITGDRKVKLQGLMRPYDGQDGRLPLSSPTRYEKQSAIDLPLSNQCPQILRSTTYQGSKPSTLSSNTTDRYYRYLAICLLLDAGNRETIESRDQDTDRVPRRNVWFRPRENGGYIQMMSRFGVQ
ncbi:9900_t:CDS:2 [Acaulospora morrowiae]|uniref:9900_t:CDS:1 n=1 Tax=Acaulospora morrowiae TaxID=94023 RepID=A0A9N8Z0L4_9GLOM|nr:9900_t:CDS:2 [Acaulospora morrowiae]